MTAIDTDLDLVLERIIPIPPQLAYRGWTEPELITQWFTPKPWRTPHVEVDLRPGGKFVTVMEGPDGERFEGEGCFLELIPDRKIVWTSALKRDYRPQNSPNGGFAFTCTLTFTPEGTGTRYKAVACHADAAGAKSHADMGFHSGWGAALDQLVELMQSKA